MTALVSHPIPRGPILRSTPSGASAVALLCLLGQFVALAHALVVRHVTCFEHGESVHAGLLYDRLQTTPEMSARTPRPSAPALPALLPTTLDTLASGHEDCPLAGFRATRLVPTPKLTVLPVMTVLRAWWPSGSAHRALARLYRMAPKTSPPNALTV